MKAITMTEPGGPEVLRVSEIAKPEPGPGDVLIRVEAACVNPVDLATRAGVFHGRWFEGKPTLGLGWDACGVIEQVGTDVKRFSVGERVLCMNDQFKQPSRCYAEYLIAAEPTLARCPAGLDPVVAATLPMNTATADQSLAALQLPEGSTVLITGAAAAVGGFAVSLAAEHGLRAIGLAAAKDEELVRSFGAIDFVPRGTAYTELTSIDAVVDAAQVGQEAIGAVRDNGVFVAVSPSSAPEPERGITVHTVLSKPIGYRLEEMALMAQAGKIFPRVAGKIPLTEAAEAHRLAEQGTTRARWVLIP